MHRIHVGVTPWLEDWHGDASALAEQAQLAEAWGFDSLWLPESHFTGSSANPAPLLRLAVVAARTRRLRLGTTSFLLPVRHPLHVAQEVAVLDRLSAGRVILGVGRGFRRGLFTAFAVPPEEKRERFEAALHTILAAWRGEPVAWEENDDEGEASPLRIAPLPVQRPHPPVWVAAFGPKALSQAGRLGFPYLASPIEPFPRLLENYARHREALENRNAPATSDPAPSPAVPVMRSVFVSQRPQRVARARESLKRQAERVARARSALRHLDLSDVDDWAIVGEPQAVFESVARYRESLGLTHLIVRSHIPHMSRRSLERSLEHVGELFLG